MCLAMDRPEHLMENANLWNWVWEGVRFEKSSLSCLCHSSTFYHALFLLNCKGECNSRRDIDIMLHMGGQVFSEGVFLESQCLMNRLELLNAMVPPIGDEKARVEDQVRVNDRPCAVGS